MALVSGNNWDSNLGNSGLNLMICEVSLFDCGESGSGGVRWLRWIFLGGLSDGVAWG